MYNFNGLVHTSCILFIFAVIFIIFASVFFFFEKKKITLKKEKETNKRKAEKLRKKEKQIIIESILMFCISLCLLSLSCFYAYKSHNPTIVYQDCYFHSTFYYRGHEHYTFSVDNEKLSLNMPNKEEIYPDKFSKDTLYRVYYEKSTSYIVKIEEIDE